MYMYIYIHVYKYIYMHTYIYICIPSATRGVCARLRRSCYGRASHILKLNMHAHLCLYTREYAQVDARSDTLLAVCA
jgi:hypothetical protein